MGDLLAREARFQKTYRWVLAGYALICVGLAVFWAVRTDWYQFFQAMANLAMPFLYWAVFKLLRLTRVYQVDLVILLFTFLAYTLGVAARVYHLLLGYDKIMHMLSGAFTMYLAIPTFYTLKSEKPFQKTDCALAVAFCIMTTLAVAGLWEIVEFFINLVTGIDLQNVAATGVYDTMMDMIVCTLGALCVLPAMLAYYRKGKTGFLMGAAMLFVEKNPRNRIARTSE